MSGEGGRREGREESVGGDRGEWEEKGGRGVRVEEGGDLVPCKMKGS